MEFIGSLLKEESKKFYLNTSKSQSLQVCLDAVYPEFKLVIRLTDHDQNQCYIDFTLKSWKSFLDLKEKIRSNMNARKEEIVFINDQLKVFTQIRHGDIVICFMDFTSQTVNIRSWTFQQMSEFSKEVTSTYSEYKKKIKSKSNLLKSFVESVIQKDSDDNKQKNNASLFEVFNNIQNMPNDENVENASGNNSSSEETDDDEESDPESEMSENNCCDCGCYRCGTGYY